MSGAAKRSKSRRSIRGFVGSSAVAAFALAFPSPAIGSSEDSEGPAVRRFAAVRAFSGFLENRGQWDSEVKFFARAGGIDLTLTNDALVFRPTPPVRDTGEPSVEPWMIRLPGEGKARVLGDGARETRHHFLFGSRSGGTHRDVLGFDSVVYEEVIPGIDLIVRFTTELEKGFSYDLRVAPGARLEDFMLEFEGGSDLEIDPAGTLSMSTAAGRVRQRIGASWQIDPKTGLREDRASYFRDVSLGFRGNPRIGFAAPDRDPTREYVLDPSLSWATYLGGSGLDNFAEMDVGPSGAVYLLCQSKLMPTTPGAHSPSMSGGIDAWIGRLSADGTTLNFATFLGGSESETPIGIDLAADGTIVVVGDTWSNDFPTTPGSLQPNFVGVNPLADAFVARLTANGSAIVWATYYGSTNYEQLTCSALAPNGDVIIAGQAAGSMGVGTPGAFDPIYTPKDAYLTRISADGTQRVFHTYFSVTRVLDMVVATGGDICFSGTVSLPDHDGPLPATPGAHKPSVTKSSVEGFVARLNGDGTTLKWATYLGGDEGYDDVWGIALDAAEAVYVVGQTSSIDFPTTPGAFDVLPKSISFQGFASKLLPGGSKLVWSTFLGPKCCNGGGYKGAVTADRAGNSHSVGSANESQFATTLDAFQPNYIGPFPYGDMHLTKLDSFGESLEYSTWFGGPGSDHTGKVGLGSDQFPRIAFNSSSPGVPTTSGAFDNTHNGDLDIVVAKFEIPVLPWVVLGGGKPGANDTPNLAGGGTLQAGATTRVSLRGGAENSPCLLFAGITSANLSIPGGVLLPAPDLVVPLMTTATGGFDLIFAWPVAPAGIGLHLQTLVIDANASFGYAASNGLKLISQ